MAAEDSGCVFCKIARRQLPASVVYETDDVIAFLDSHPLFPGHVLLCPREHCATLMDVPKNLGGALMDATQLLAGAVESAMSAEGTFIAVNNRVSQTVPHLHIHVVPRRRGDGLRGFFWPRNRYKDDQAREAARTAIEREVQQRLRQNASG